MSHAYHDILFTPAVLKEQTERGSRKMYAREDAGDEVEHATLTPEAAAFLAQRDSFYIATVSETGWPYVQHRGGPAGFVKVLDNETIGFADFAGNRQYVSLGNLTGDDRVSLFFMDYANRGRLKILGHAKVIGPDDPRLQTLADQGYRARIERGMLIRVEGFDWNCSSHISPRYTLAEVEQATAKITARVAELEAELARLRGNSTDQGP